MTSISFFSSGGPDAPALQEDLEGAGLNVVGSLALGTMVQEVIRAAPDVIVCYETCPSDALFAITSTLQQVAPRPLVLFTADPDVEKIERAASAGIHVYVVDGYAAARLRSIVHVAQVRFRREQLLCGARDRFAELRFVDRVRDILARNCDTLDGEPSRAQRHPAAPCEQPTGPAAQQMIDAALFAGAINRAGQLRMLSQRLVKLYAQGCIGIAAAVAEDLCRASVAQVDDNLAVLGRTLPAATFGALLEGVLTPWAALKLAVRGPPDAARLREVDALAERLLVTAEALTRSLEMAGFTAALHVINVSGRQRMLSQRIAKAAILSISPGAGSTSEVQALRAEEDFEQGLAFLATAPISTAEIRTVMVAGLETWAKFKWAVTAPAAASAEVATLSEVLLARFDELTRLYEQGSRALVHDEARER